jgi:phosphoglycolate phosphatase
MLRRTAIVFDLDGTLVDSAPDLAAATDHVLARHGRPPVGLAGIRTMVGDGARAMLERGFDATGGRPDETEFKAALAEFMTWYGAHVADTTKPFPGVREALTELRALGCSLAVCTNKSERFSRDLLTRLGLLPLFGALVGGDTLPVKKPDGGHILGTLARLGQPARKAVMVGDSINDILAARNAAVPAVAVSFGYTQIPVHDLGAQIVIDRFADLIPALRRL